MDVRRSVREALTRRVADTTWWPPEDATRFHNRLLDDCGDAARPEVGLLMRLHAGDIGGRLPAAVLSHAAWERERGTLVTVFANELAANGVVAPELLVWALDTWAIALAVIDEALLAPPPPRSPVRRSSAGTRAAPTGRHGHAGAPAIGSGGHASSAGHAGPARAWPFGPIARAAPTPNHWTYRVNLDALTFGGLAFLGLFSAGAEWWMARQSRLHPRVATAAAPVAAASSSTTLASVPDSMTRVEYRSDAATDAGAVSAARAARAPDAPPADTIFLRGGGRVVGTIGVIAETHLYVTERASGLPFEYRLASVDRVVTHAGRVLRFEGGATDSVHTASLIVRGVGGRYVVRRRVLAVSGDSSCASAALAVDPVATTEEEIAHAPGAQTFTMPSRPGVSGTIAPDGRFETVMISGERAMGDFSWRMVGQFTATGFVADADASTAVVTRWRDSQTCRFLTELTGVRRP